MKPYYQDDLVTLFHCDARDLLGTPWLEDVVVTVTDPPYGKKMKQFRDDFQATLEILNAVPGGILASFMTPGKELDQFMKAMTTWEFQRILPMWKAADIAWPWRGWCMNTELRVVFSRKGAQWPRRGGYKVTSDTAKVGPWERLGHPAGKPLGVCEDLIQKTHREGAGVILDPFCGAGAIPISAKRLGRPVVCCDVEEKWCGLTVENLAKWASCETGN